MKKLLLSTFSVALLATTASAQLSAGKDGYNLVQTDGASQCNANSAPNNGGIMNGDGTSISASELTTNGLELTAADPIPAGANATWFALPAIVGSGETAVCSSLFDVDPAAGVDMSTNGILSITFQSNVDGALLEVFVGGTGQWNPSTSSFNDGTGASVITQAAAVGADTDTRVDFNLSDSTLFANWSGKSAIQSIGYRAATAGAKFIVKEVQIGSAVKSVSGVNAASVNVYPNPASDVLNVVVGSGNASVSLSSVTGAVVASAAGTGTVALNTSNVPAGLYVVTVSSGAGVTTAKVVVR